MITRPLRWKQRTTTTLAVGVMVLLAGVLAPTAAAAPPKPDSSATFNVLAHEDATSTQVEQVVKAAGGTVVDRNDAVGLLTVRAPATGFADRATRSSAVIAAAPVRSIGQAPDIRTRRAKDMAIERDLGNGNATPNRAAKPRRLDPLDSRLWGLTSIRADLAREKTIGDKLVKVGILDTGVDGKHPDIAPNFNRALSRNFTKDIPFDELGQEVDGPCEHRGCVDPADEDDGGHGTHVAGTVAAAVNGFGLSGVAPGVSIVNIRGGQDSGWFFLQPVVNALTYAADQDLDVVNMSFFVDPWLYNCDSHPADTPDQQAQQRLTKAAVARALRYAHHKGVTLIAAYGNEATDQGKPKPDVISPNFPAGGGRMRTIDNASCQSMPGEGPHVINVAAYGPSGAKADYSTYGVEGISVSAPGGYRRDHYGTPWFNSLDNLILSTWPRAAAEHEGLVDAAGNLTPDGQAAGLIKLDQPGAYYRPLQGTSMAAPHAAGVAALIVSTYGTRRGTDITMAPDKVRKVLEGTATKTPCPTPRTVDYLREGRPGDWTASCEGGTEFNGFYGHGQVDALQAISHGRALIP